VSGEEEEEKSEYRKYMAEERKGESGMQRSIK
jgi:hypothetical protein